MKGAEMTELDPWYEARAQMVAALEADLLGDASQTTLNEAPLDRYLMGILRPQPVAGASETVPEDEDERAEDGVSGADAAFDPAVALTRVRYPSSMGLTFAVDAAVTPHVEVAVRAARFEAYEGAREAAADGPRVRGGSGRRDEVWTRSEVAPPPITVSVAPARSAPEEVAPGLQLHVVTRPAVRGVVTITLVLVNTQFSDKGRDDGKCWFQPSISVSLRSGGLVDRPSPRPAGIDDEDLDSYQLLFRDVRNVAVGHGCAVEWNDGPEVKAVNTTFLPRHELPLSEPGGASTADLRMTRLAETGDVAPLRELVAEYRRWIELKARSAVELELPELRAQADKHLGAARHAADRMDAGIARLEHDDLARSAFRAMNAAMQAQRARQEMIRAGRSAPDEKEHSWRAFQIAFILLNLEGLTDPQSADRGTADLLWFPTGGGKTEAYLGLIAYTILLRRLRDPRDAGVSVLMRYTLRLLTIQQFERAAGLICALEVERRELVPASEPISLGLWVGQGATPNKVEQAYTALRGKKKSDDGDDDGSPLQLLRCPWCGADLTAADYKIDRAKTRLTIHCSSSSCTFADGLPVHVVDEDVYRERPSLVIGTVDKFAMLAWNAEAGKLFSTDGKHSPPDLIVQDELHLISGPLGTLVGLYEAAIDAACSRTGVIPKVVASTATIRRARRQVRAVFDREAEQFPPSGLDAKDSFFAVEASPAEKGTRQYVGVLAPGVSQATLIVRSYAALLQAGQRLQVPDEVRDAYWTLLGYFNSLRVLGGAYMQVIDDVPGRLEVIAKREGEQPRPLPGGPREMTSRKKSTEIPVELALLGTPYPKAPSVVLATNMISVGVDVDRLGLMAVAGQPQTTAEYIQATSRVGRRHPGLVVVLYNSARTRDLSHYESFATYHRSLYRQVEATGATPFAERARDRGLHGVLVAFARLLVDGATGDTRAGTIEEWGDQLEQTSKRLLDRAARVDEAQVPGLRDQIDELITAWRGEVGLRKYAGWFERSNVLLVPPGGGTADDGPEFPVHDAPWPTLTSLRDVDTETALKLVREERVKKSGE
ncbi:helicase [Kineococcus vitellinus]|uniref:helicase n=1 Tax=Kineococcus vitellinus TaxID=2696565 RepID=UPI003B833ED8